MESGLCLTLLVQAYQCNDYYRVYYVGVNYEKKAGTSLHRRVAKAID
jgi:hypothetical protein